jgi:Xaa-Pro dipeptidase
MRSVKNRISAVLKNSKANSLVLFNSDSEDPNFQYLTGFRGGSFEYTPLVVRKNELKLFASELEYGIAKRERPKEMEVVLVDRNTDLKKALSDELGKKTIGINGRFLPYRLYLFLSKLRPKPTKIIDASEAFALARLVKDEEEIASIRKAVAITKRAIESVKNELKVGMRETEVASMIDTHMLADGARSAFRSIVSFDANTALPHHSPSGSRLRMNSIVLFDVGAKWNGYCGDITRTFMFKPDTKSEKYKRFTEMYSVVEKAQEIALAEIKEGNIARKAHNSAAKYMDSYRRGIYKGKFIHALGHSIGLEVHDGSAGLSPGSKMRLKRNMVFSDEPGIYVEGFGGVRIEDDVLVGKGSSSFL